MINGSCAVEKRIEKLSDLEATVAGSIWQKPEVVGVIPMASAQGNGGGGPDFASEVS